MTPWHFIVSYIIGAVVGAVVTWVVVDGDWKDKTVERGLAFYCPLDGKWAWIGECAE